MSMRHIPIVRENLDYKNNGKVHGGVVVKNYKHMSVRNFKKIFTGFLGAQNGCKEMQIFLGKCFFLKVGMKILHRTYAITYKLKYVWSLSL